MKATELQLRDIMATEVLTTSAERPATEATSMMVKAPVDSAIVTQSSWLASFDPSQARVSTGIGGRNDCRARASSALGSGSDTLPMLPKLGVMETVIAETMVLWI
jgi:hypothetical protein